MLERSIIAIEYELVSIIVNSSVIDSALLCEIPFALDSNLRTPTRMTSSYANDGTHITAKITEDFAPLPDVRPYATLFTILFAAFDAQ